MEYMSQAVAPCKWFTIFQEPLEPRRQTHAYTIRNNNSGESLGRIKWYGSWRQYCFLPEADTVWSDGCLADVERFLTKLRARQAAKMRERRHA